MESEALAVHFTLLDWVWTFLLVALMILCGVVFCRLADIHEHVYTGMGFGGDG